MQGLNLRTAGLAVVFGAALFTGAVAQEKSITVQMTGASEKPVGDPDGTGTATLKINPAKPEVCYTLKVANVAAATMAHIHKAAAGASGPPVVTLTAPNAAGMSEGCATVNKEVAMALETSPGDYYVNVHTADFPGGAVRGQLH